MQTYPIVNGDITATWSEEDRKAYLAACAEAEQATKALEASEAIDKAARESPAAMIEALKRDAAEKRAQLAAADRERLDKAALVEAEQRYGVKDKDGRVVESRVAVIETRSGDVIVRCPSQREADEFAARVSAEGLADGDRERIARDWLAGLVVHPDKAGLKEKTDLYPALWGKIREVVDHLSTGASEASAKKG